MTISFVIPSMRPIQVKRVLHDLNNQTMMPSRVILYDNSTRFVRDETQYRYYLEIIRPKRNIGTNPVWNIALRLDDAYCGILGDDYRLDPTMIEKMVYSLNISFSPNKDTGAVVPQIIQQRRRKPPENTFCDLNELQGRRLNGGKGECSAVLMKREVAHRVPLIPRMFKIFYGDNWIGHHIRETLALTFVKISPCPIYHIPGENNVSASLDYRSVYLSERILWKNLIRSERFKRGEWPY